MPHVRVDLPPTGPTVVWQVTLDGDEVAPGSWHRVRTGSHRVRLRATVTAPGVVASAVCDMSVDVAGEHDTRRIVLPGCASEPALSPAVLLQR